MFGCGSPPDPPPVAHGAASTAPYVQWRRDREPVAAPVVVFVDTPGGPMDRIAADPDVTTFLNDRFHPVFRTALDGQAVGTVRFFDGCGCALGESLAPATPAAFIEAANAVIVLPEARRCTSPHLRWECLRL
ncbi:MAG: hypothetical protein ACOZNI_10215 [Myxococcota bacterium]